MKVSKIASNAEYRINEQFQNMPNFGFPHWKKSRNLLIFQFRQFQKFAIRKIKKIVNFENSKNLQFEKFQKLSNRKIPKIFNWKNSKKLHF